MKARTLRINQQTQATGVIKKMNIDDIDPTIGIQTRVSKRLVEERIEEYAEGFKEGARFPPIIVYEIATENGQVLKLVDGFYRRAASSRAGLQEIECEVRNGTEEDALRAALAANATHGLSRSNADKQNAVKLALTHFPQSSDKAIAKIVGVSDRMVAAWRQKVEGSETFALIRQSNDGKRNRKNPQRCQKGASEASCDALVVDIQAETVDEESSSTVQRSKESTASTPPSMEDQAQSSITSNANLLGVLSDSFDRCRLDFMAAEVSLETRVKAFQKLLSLAESTLTPSWEDVIHDGGESRIIDRMFEIAQSLLDWGSYWHEAARHAGGEYCSEEERYNEPDDDIENQELRDEEHA